MSFDGLFTYCMAEELRKTLKSGRIVKIHQPFVNEIIMTVRANGENHKVLLSAHPSYARAQITKHTYENPKEPPMFCMVLRKHLEGFFIEDIIQHKNLDRTIIFKIKGYNEIGDLSYKQLIIEIMGRHSNIILVDEAKGNIIESIKHISYAVNRYRAILPGQPYQWPPEQSKINPLEANEEDILRNIDFNGGKFDKQIVENFSGISPFTAKEIIARAGLVNRNTLPKTMVGLMEKVKNYQIQPTLIRGDQKDYFYLFPLQHVEGEVSHFKTLSALLDQYYLGKAERDHVKQIAGNLIKFVQNEIEKNKKKIIKLEKTLKDAENSSKYQLYGELLTANLYAVKKGMKEIEVVNYYDESGGTITIPLNPQKEPAVNAQNYFKKYQKAKNAQVIVKEQITQTKDELLYFESLLQQLESASPKDLEEIKEELVEQGYLKNRQKKTKKKINNKPLLEKYISSDGTEIYVGKNNKQNDYLTMKFARKDDIWLHTKDIPGSHVVIKNNDPNEETILEAAMIAAYFSKARNSSSVPVDFTKIKNVRKPSGAKPGFVIYDNQQTVYVTPQIDKIQKLKAK